MNCKVAKQRQHKIKIPKPIWIYLFLPTLFMVAPIVVESRSLDRLYIEAIILKRIGFMSECLTLAYIGANAGNVKYIN